MVQAGVGFHRYCMCIFMLLELSASECDVLRVITVGLKQEGSRKRSSTIISSFKSLGLTKQSNLIVKLFVTKGSTYKASSPNKLHLIQQKALCCSEMRKVVKVTSKSFGVFSLNCSCLMLRTNNMQDNKRRKTSGDFSSRPSFSKARVQEKSTGGSPLYYHRSKQSVAAGVHWLFQHTPLSICLCSQAEVQLKDRWMGEGFGKKGGGKVNNQASKECR